MDISSKKEETAGSFDSMGKSDICGCRLLPRSLWKRCWERKWQEERREALLDD